MISSVGHCPGTSDCDSPSIQPTDDLKADDIYAWQHALFADEFIEVSQDLDKSPYVAQDDVLYSLSEPYLHIGHYPHLVLPQQACQRFIDQCHAEASHAAAAEKTLLHMPTLPCPWLVLFPIIAIVTSTSLPIVII